MKPFAIAGIQMKVSAVASNVEMMKLKIDITMNLYPWIEMIVFSELCAFGPLSHAAQPFQIILKQKCKLKLKNMEYGYCQVLSSKKAKVIYTIQHLLLILRK
jgi:hypothetical protein